MRLRLGLLYEDIVDRFENLPKLPLRIFTKWIRVLSKLAGDALNSWLPQEAN